MDVRQRFNVYESGNRGAQPVVFVHGFGCDQSMWRWMRPHFESTYRVITYDLAGLGGSHPDAYEPARFTTLRGYSDDLITLCDELALEHALVVGHSVGSTIALLAAGTRPDLFHALALLVPSVRYIDDDGYAGGFSAADIDDLLESLDSNYLGWASTMAPLIMGQPDRPELGEELRNLFCQADPTVASRFARATFLGDNRQDLDNVRTPCLVVECREDLIAPPSATRYVHEQLATSTLVSIDATGHCPNLSAPDETSRKVLEFHRDLLATIG